LGQPFEASPTRRRTASGSVPEWFANLLPERESGLRRLVGQELGKENPHDFQVITFLGEDLPGAVRVVAESNLADIPELSQRDEPSRDYQIHWSLAGMQMKFSMRWTGKGLVLPMSGEEGNWIVKLPDRRFRNVPENEYAMLRWATLIGIQVPETKLYRGSELPDLPSGFIGQDEVAFAIRRFDRFEGRRVHQEDFAQAREVAPDLKYENATYSGLARFVGALCPEEDLDEYLRRVSAMVIMGNLDAHLKNWTIQYPDGRSPRLSPAYDFVSVSSYPEFSSPPQLAFPINGGRLADNIILENFRQLALRANLDVDHVLGILKRTVDAMIESWPQVKVDCDIPGFIVSHIEERLSRHPVIAELQAPWGHMGR
jgi:serine/threonine-protein kinase HipA